MVEGGFNWSGVDPPLSSSRACLMAFIANSVPRLFVSRGQCLAVLSFPSSLNGARVGLHLLGSGHCRRRTEFRA